MNQANALRPFLLAAVLLMLVLSMRRAAGRLAPRAAIAPIVFLVTRWPVLVAWGIGASGMLLMLLPGALAKGHDTLSDFLLLGGLSLFCGLGVAPLGVGLPFMLIRAFAAPPPLALEPGELVLHERLGNHFLRGEGRGGKLVVTTRRLAFKSHRFNVQLAPWSVPLENIVSLETEGERFLVIKTAGGDEPEWLVTAHPHRVAEFVNALRERPEAERAGASSQALHSVGLSAALAHPLQASTDD